MQLPYQKTFLGLLILASLPPWLLHWQWQGDPLGPLQTVHELSGSLALLLSLLLGGAALLLLAYPPARPALALWWSGLRRRLGTDRGPYYELLARLRNFDNQDDQLRAGRMARQFGDQRAALMHLGRAFEHDPSHLPSAYEFGLLLHSLGQLPEAGALLSKVVEADPEHGNGDALLHLAEIQFTLGETAAAARSLERHQRQYPGHRRVHLMRARLEASRGAMERAQEELRAARRSPDAGERLTPEDRLAQAKARVTILRRGTPDEQ